MTIKELQKKVAGASLHNQSPSLTNQSELHYWARKLLLAFELDLYRNILKEREEAAKHG